MLDCLPSLLGGNREKQLTETCFKKNGENEPGNVPTESKRMSNIEVIDLSDDDAENESIGSNDHVLDYDNEGMIWFYSDPNGNRQGPFTVAALRRWSDAGYFPPNFKVWRKGQSENEAVYLYSILLNS